MGAIARLFTGPVNDLRKEMIGQNVMLLLGCGGKYDFVNDTFYQKGLIIKLQRYIFNWAMGSGVILNASVIKFGD